MKSCFYLVFEDLSHTNLQFDHKSDSDLRHKIFRIFTRYSIIVTLPLDMLLGISLTYRRNINGRNMRPWGVPNEKIGRCQL